MVECFLDVEKVRGSSPLSRTNKSDAKCIAFLFFDYNYLGRETEYHNFINVLNKGIM